MPFYYSKPAVINRQAKSRWRYNHRDGVWSCFAIQLFTKVPRKGLWNTKSCLEWYNDGCPSTNSYTRDIYNQIRKIVGYDPTDDMLILGQNLIITKELTNKH